MPTFMISYDNRNDDNDAFGEQMRDWNCTRPLATLWFGKLNSDALSIREMLRSAVGKDEGLFICEIKPTCDWATMKMHFTVSEWVRENIGG